MSMTHADTEVFSIKQAAERTGLSEDTIRYYEKIALLPRAKRKENGHRIYYSKDIETLKLIGCLKKTGMPLEEMRPFLQVSVDADPGDYPELVDFMKMHREHIVEQIVSLQQVVDFIDLKLVQGSYRQECAVEDPSTHLEPAGQKSKSKSVSPLEMGYFPQ
ncbi:MerR family transcriptional regulator [Paenibacillus senegalimassiliensis]|uniref:MerR family transcriptional regulator n=1 Tax=Paenibacillus senegalimassiliensis TaxID=1737426 RepID=UPI00073F8ACF|nr:MerR family transcriptional regulator [Paenibacillus senegalimassiliensis]